VTAIASIAELADILERSIALHRKLSLPCECTLTMDMESAAALSHQLRLSIPSQAMSKPASPRLKPWYWHRLIRPVLTAIEASGAIIAAEVAHDGHESLGLALIVALILLAYHEGLFRWGGVSRG
jgi:hypothetical protein